MSPAFAILLAVTAAIAPVPADGGGSSDAQIIVVEVPPSARQTPSPTVPATPAPTVPATPAPTPSAAAPSAPRSNLPATGRDAAALAVAVLLGVAALVVGILVRRRRRPVG